MMMKKMAALLCALSMAGCSSVLVKEPFPDSALTEQEQSQLAGIWRLDDQVVSLAFANDGTPWLAAVEWKDDDFRLDKYRLHFTKRNGALYVSMPSEPGGTNGFFFAEIKPGSRGICVWAPDVDAFADLVGRGTLQGGVEKNQHAKTVRLDNPSSEILDLVSTNGALFNYKDPLLFRKVD